MRDYEANRKVDRMNDDEIYNYFTELDKDILK